jgi:hypothetical protein
MGRKISWKNIGMLALAAMRTGAVKKLPFLKR